MADYAIIVPKHDELRAIEWAFATTLRAPDEKTPSGVELYRRDLPIGAVTFALLDRQTNTYSSFLTADVISKETPRLAFLVGTAMGNPHRVGLGSVVVSDGITDISEKRLVTDNGPTRYVTRGPVRCDELTYDARDFIARHFTPARTQSVVRAMTRRPALLQRGTSKINEIVSLGPQVVCEPIVSGNEYHMGSSEAPAAAVWDQVPVARAYDMEAAGFALAAHNNRVPWLVVRGISDLGTPETKDERNRAVAAGLAGRFLVEFLGEGLLRSAVLLPDREPASTIALLRDEAYRLDGAWRGAMAYLDDAGNPVVFEESAEFAHSGADITGLIRSRRIMGVPRHEALEYRVSFTIAKHGYAGGVWSETDATRKYFGVLLGRFGEESTVLSGTWHGTHRGGARRGFFKWKNVHRDGRPTDLSVDLDSIVRELVSTFDNQDRLRAFNDTVRVDSE